MKLTSERDDILDQLSKTISALESSSEDCTHTLNVVNFGPDEVVSYPIVRIVGVAESKSSSCRNQENIVRINIEKLKLERRIPLVNKKFKALVELEEGENILTLSFGCRQLELNLQYCPAVSEYNVLPLYVVCEGHDGYFQAPSYERNDVKSACNRILLGSKLLQCFTAEKLYENNLGRKTFALENKCQIFKSKVNFLVARKMSQEELWNSIGRDIMNSELASEKKKYLAFLSCTKYNGNQFTEELQTHEDFLRITDAYVALGGGGLALFGTASLYTWPEDFEDITFRLEDERKVDRFRFLDDSCYRGTLGSCFSTTLGSVLHELYHTFNLGHTEKGVMGRGFDNINNFFVSVEDQIKTEEIATSFQDQIEFKEEFEADKLSERLIREHKKKDFSIIKKFEDNDCTYLTKSCAVILAYHRWFNVEQTSSSCTLSYDPSSKFIRSTGGIRVVEVRRNPDEMILYDWTFEGKVLKFSFCIPDEVFTGKISSTLFVLDNCGNILKQNI